MTRAGDPFRRWIRRLRGALRQAPARFVYHPGYRAALSAVPSDPLRADRIVAWLLDERLARGRDLSRPIPASLENIGRIHSASYLDSLDQAETLEAVFGVETSAEQAQRAIDQQRLLTGGTIQATRLALSGARVVMNLGGGLHHAGPNQGMAFCVFNDIGVALARLRARGFDEPVLVVDLDVHDGNGTRAIFADDPTVHTYSVHADTWDDRPAVADTCIALGADVTDETYLEALRSTLPVLFAAHRPGLVIYVAGADPAADDLMGNWRVSAAGMLERDRFVADLVKRAGGSPPLVILLAGGYGNRAWQYTARFAAWLLSGRLHEPREGMEGVVRLFRRIEGEARERDRRGFADVDWSMTEEDLGAVAPATGQDGVLGSFSKHAIELSLERFGILTQIRSLGFTAPNLVVDATPPLGHTIRLFGDPERAELLMELRVSRNRSAIPGCDLLFVEWLLLQDPRKSFRPERPPLPGQRHPGLGLLREILAWMVLLCERLEIDGILFVASHYYMARLGRRHLRFLEPEQAAAYDAFRDCVRGLEVGEASRLILDGRVVDARTGEPVAWPAPSLVLPVSERLRVRAAGEDQDRAYREARGRFALRLAG